MSEVALSVPDQPALKHQGETQRSSPFKIPTCVPSWTHTPQALSMRMTVIMLPCCRNLISICCLCSLFLVLQHKYQLTETLHRPLQLTSKFNISTTHADDTNLVRWCRCRLTSSGNSYKSMTLKCDASLLAINFASKLFPSAIFKKYRHMSRSQVSIYRLTPTGIGHGAWRQSISWHMPLYRLTHKWCQSVDWHTHSTD